MTKHFGPFFFAQFFSHFHFEYVCVNINNVWEYLSFKMST